MQTRISTRFRHACSFGLLGLCILCASLVGISALSNRILPTQSPIIDRLSDLEKNNLAEAIHLHKTLGDAAWPGWGQVDIPFIVYNEQYAFLVGYPDPPGGWTMMPRREARGGPWEAVPGDTFFGQVYYRQRLLDPEKTPENFTVLVGERWVATMETNEFSEIAFYAGLKKDLPPILAKLLPLRLAWGFLMGQTESYISALEHEAYHAYQGSEVPSRLAASEEIMVVEGKYPFDDPDMDRAWKQEMDSLLKAVEARSESDARTQARQFLAQRDARRATANLSVDLVDLERQREWLEGLAKYNELSIGRLAGSTTGYQPIPALSQDPAFKKYADRANFWSQQLNEAKRTAGRSGETRFYYSGNALAVVLDRLAPGWKERIMIGDLFLEDLLREAVRS